MSKYITSILLLVSAVLVAACTSSGPTRTDTVAAAEEFIIVQPEPISVEPVYTGKYK
ncbi:MAG: hypothetical protein ACPGRD_08930 [Planktomarina sp.]